jgi:hypothetical protein
MTPTETLQDKMASVLESGKSLHVESTGLMTDEDRHLLRYSRYQQMGAYHLFGIVLTGFIFLPFSDAPALSIQIVISVAIFMSYYTLLLVLYKRMTRVFAGEKRIIQGLITAKWLGQTRTGYGLTVGTVEIGVTPDVYRSYRIGDAVEVHQFTSWGHFVVQHRMLEGEWKARFLEMLK